MTDLEKAIQLRKNSRAEEAMALLQTLLSAAPKDPAINYQMAWTCDCLGREKEAAPFYEAAIENGLSGKELQGAWLGLGSTYRCLGEYEKSLTTFDRGLQSFPDDRALKTFRAITLHNLGRGPEAVEELLKLLLDTTSDAQIQTYDKALRFYADKLDQTWTD